MKNLKQVLALGMAFSLSLSTLASAAFTDQDSISNKNADAVELLTALDVIQGYEDGSFKPEETVTRAQMAKMIYTIRNGGNDNADAYKTVSTSFDDIQGHWAEGYIKYLQNTNIVAGKSATKFEPNAIVTTAEAMKMALVLGGYTPDKAGLTGTEWLNNTISLATTNRLDKDVVSPMAGACTRQDAAQILSNALNMYAVQWSEWTQSFVNDGANGLGTGEKITVGEKWMDLQMETGRLTQVPSGQKNAKGVRFVYKNDKNEDVPVHFKNVTGDYADLLGCEVTVVWNSDNVDSADAIYGIYASSNNEKYETIWKNVEKDGESKIKFDGKSYKVDPAGFKLYTDGTEVTGLQNADFFTASDYSDQVVLIDSDSDGDIDAAQVNKKAVVEITNVGSSTLSTKKAVGLRGDKLNEAKCDTNPDLDEVNVYDGIAKGDFAVVSYDKYTDKVTYEKLDVKTATIEATRTKNGKTEEIKVDGNWVKAAAGYTDFANISAAAGDTVEYAEMNGLVYSIKKTDGKYGSKSVAMIYNVTTSTGGDFEDSSVKVQVILRDGTKKTVKVKDFLKADGTKIAYTGSDGKLQAADIQKYLGMPVTYTGTDEMTFKLIDNTDNKAGFYAIGDADKRYLYDNDKNKFNDKEIADDAVVFLYGDNETSGDYEDNGAKVITGAQLKKAGITDGAIDTPASDEKFAVSKVNGFEYVQVMTVRVGNVDNDVSLYGSSSYGFMTSDSYEATIDGKSYRAFNIVTPDGETTVYEDTDSDYSTFLAGSVISYTVDTTKDDKTIIKDVQNMNDLESNSKKVMALGKFTSDNTDGYVGIGGDKYDIAKDATILNVNTKTNEAIDADWTAGVRETGEMNVLYILNGKDEIAFMLVDSENDQIEFTTELDSVTNVDDIDFNATNNVTVGSDLKVDKAFAVPEGKTLTVEGNLTVGDNEMLRTAVTMTVNGTLKVTKNLVIADDSFVDVGADANVRAKKIDTREKGIRGEGAKDSVFEGNSDKPYKPVDKDTEAKKVTK